MAPPPSVRPRSPIDSMVLQAGKLLLRVTDRETLFKELCRVAVEIGGFRAARVDLVDEVEAVPSADPAAGSRVSLPLHEGGRIAGVLHLEADEPLCSTEPERSALVSMAEDISFGLDRLCRETERRRTESEARAWHARLAQILDAGPIVSYALEPDGDQMRVVWVSANLERQFGFTVAEAMSPGWWPSHVHADDLEQVIERSRRIVAQGAVRHEYRFHRKDGEVRWVLDDVRTMPGLGGAPMQVLGVWTDITDRKKTEAVLLENDTRLHEVQRIARLGRWTLDLSCDELRWSKDALNILGLSATPRGPLSRALDEVLHPDDREAAHRWFDGLRWGERAEPLQVRVVEAGRTVRHLRFEGELLRGTEDQPPFGLGTVQDVSAQAAAQRALAESEERLRLALVAGRQGLYDLNVSTGEATVNDEYATMLGHDPATFRETNAAWRERLHPDDHAATSRAYEDYVAGRCADYHVEFRQRTRDGQWKWILSVGRAVDFDAEGRPRRMLGTHTDISSMKEAEAQLALDARRAEALLGLPRVAEALDEASFLQHGAALIERLTESRVSFLHFVHEDQENIELVTWSKRTQAEHSTATIDAHYPISRAGIWADAFRRREPVVFNDYASADDQRGLPTGHAPMERLLSVPVLEGEKVRMITGVGNKPTPYTEGDVATVRLVSEAIWRTLRRRRAEAALRIRETALEAAANAIVIADHRGRIEWANPAFLNLSGYSADEVLGRSPGELVGSGAHDRAFFAAIWNTILAGRVWEGEMTNRRKDGALYPQWLTITPVRSETGDVRHFIAVMRDLTDERALQDRLLQSQKLESVGRLAGGVAHDFNNLLTVITGTMDLARQRLRRDDPLDAELAEVLRASERASALTRQLLAFSRRQVQLRQLVHLNTTLGELSKMLARLIGENIEVRTDLADDLGCVSADPGQLEQVVVNLVVNARDAMPRGGQLTLTTRNVVLDPATALALDATPPGDYVALRVGDTGSGMDEATRARIFEPFFTTKPVGQGTGLGLATVYGIVRQSDGRIRIETAVGRGTEFEILLPRVPGEAAPKPLPIARSPSPAPSRPSVAAGQTTILLVDDEPALRTVAARILVRAGYRVLTAGHAAEAMALAQAHDGPIDLLLTDVIMPGASGPELAERLQQLRPGLKVLFTSGYTGDVILRHGMSPESFDFIHKPYTVDELTKQVGAVLRA